jgi:hypothetical protein
MSMRCAGCLYRPPLCLCACVCACACACGAHVRWGAGGRGRQQPSGQCCQLAWPAGWQVLEALRECDLDDDGKIGLGAPATCYTSLL